MYGLNKTASMLFSLVSQAPLGSQVSRAPKPFYMDSRELKCGSLPSHYVCVSNDWPTEPYKSPALNLPIPCVSLFSTSSVFWAYIPNLHISTRFSTTCCRHRNLHRFQLENVIFNYIFRRDEPIYEHVSIPLPPNFRLKELKKFVVSILSVVHVEIWSHM